MKYQGCVTDYSWIKAVFEQPHADKRQYLVERSVEIEKVDQGFDFIYGIKTTKGESVKLVETEGQYQSAIIFGICFVVAVIVFLCGVVTAP